MADKMSIQAELFADNIGEIVLTGALVRIDLVSLSATEKDAAGAARREFRQRVVMPVDGFIHSFSLMEQVMQQLEKNGLAVRKPVPAAPPPAPPATAATPANVAAPAKVAAPATVAGAASLPGGASSPNFK